MNDNTVMTQKESGIYQIRNVKSGKVYVGQTNKLSYRKSQHFRSLLDNKHYNKYLQRAFNKYGEKAFAFEVLEYCHSEELNERERYWIDRQESEYADKGYNAAYAVTLFNNYEKSRKINKSKRKPNPVNYTDEVRKKARTSLARYWSNEENRIKHSLSKSEIDYKTIVTIKTLLKNDLDIKIKEVAKRFNVSLASVQHIKELASHKYILDEYNFIIKNRHTISEKRKNKVAIQMYRDGYSYQEIGDIINIHHRTVIRRINSIKTEHDDRCRLNTINRASRKKTSLVRTLSNMGYNDVQISRLLRVSRSNVCAIRNGSSLKTFDDVNQVRGKAKPFEYKISSASKL